jgi:hypothetical protein
VIRFRPAAARELTADVRYYNKHYTGRGDRFAAAVERALFAIVESPGGFRSEERGANTWLVVPNDEGVFEGAEDRDGVPCVHPLQAYLDLKGQPERATEAAADLRKQLLT